MARSEEKRLKSERKFMLAMVETSWQDQRNEVCLHGNTRTPGFLYQGTASSRAVFCIRARLRAVPLVSVFCIRARLRAVPYFVSGHGFEPCRIVSVFVSGHGFEPCRIVSETRGLQPLPVGRPGLTPLDPAALWHGVKPCPDTDPSHRALM